LREFRNISRKRDGRNRAGVAAFSIMKGQTHAECDFRRGTATNLACYYTGKINSPSARARADATLTRGNRELVGVYARAE